MSAANEKTATLLTSTATSASAGGAILSKAAPAQNASFASTSGMGAMPTLMSSTNNSTSGVPMAKFGLEPTPNAASGDPFAKFGGAVSTGTSIMAVAFNGGIVIAADSRTSTGDYVSNRVSDKLTKVHDYIYCARSGSAADTQAISDIVSYYLDIHAIELNGTPKVQTAAVLFQDIIYQNKDRLMAGIIVGGWDKKNGGQVYSITLGGTMVRQPYAIGGSGSAYIYGLCDSEFKLGMTKLECQKLVQKALSHAMARDGSSGGVIRMVTIDESGVERAFTPGDKLPFQAEQMF